jgi:hypothetical protein
MTHRRLGSGEPAGAYRETAVGKLGGPFRLMEGAMDGQSL